ncbi:site-specific DNA-methyltransferase [Pseudoclavibacter chungangensis]|uniref:Site-specific DNA-methyltransferase n=1 Tax=Pseudoclavibacter chungangensis TaxID=587635 RepID=A0A7J5BM71_9MICO|nr:site-specific DNA-methyltransferase [Pseudoclavibacter chungangensis]KAB1652038.1 site-specific DNA-methyltransferase [Pseudoclavibacter chungangensis]NYJ67566.1 adenine-specific DNA-methyltransferase [Pseudoclavibacter chungangensis]
MEKRALHSPDLTARNVERIAELFPQVITESRDAEGNVTLAVDFDLLRQELSDHIVEGPQERYQLDWPGKRAAAFAANAPIAKTLRPVREESVDFDTTRNLFIEGDNLEALKLLQESYLGKVKLIYIDPPYNTGNDFVYEDDFAESSADYLARSGQRSETGDRLVANTEANGRFHSDWLSMMYPRLKLAKNLLTDDGVLVVSIDENEHASLVRLGEEVLGDASYVGEVVLKNSSKNDQAYVSIQHEYIVFFVKNRQANAGEWVEKKEGLDKIYAAFDGFRKKHGDDWGTINAEAKAWYKTFQPSDAVYGSKHYEWMDARGIYFASDISGPNDGQYVYDVTHPATGEFVKIPASGWRYPKDEMLRRIEEGRVHFGEDHTSVPKNKTYLANTEYQSLTSIRYVDGRAASKRLAALFGEKVFTNPKDEFLLRDIYRAVGVTGDDVVLDMFAGSGSAMQAVLELNRGSESSCRFIGIQVAEDLNETLKTAKGAAKQITTNAIKLLARLGRPATVAEITKQRMRLVHEQLADDLLLDSGFRVLKIDTSNLVDTLAAPDALVQDTLDGAVASVKEGRTSIDLLFQVILDWALDLSEPVKTERVADRELLSVADDALIACFEDDISDSAVRTIAARRPLRAVFLDAGFASDAARINAEQILREVSPETEVRTI